MPDREHAPYRGFLAGLFSGITKLTVGHPFDTLKVRLQTSPRTRFSGPLSCLRSTLRHEGARALYKGATPPLIGWMFMDSLMLGSLHHYRSLLLPLIGADSTGSLPTWGHALAGVGSGCTVSLVAAPIEHVKARLQVQYRTREYAGPVDCVRRVYAGHGVRGVFRGLAATMVFRGFFFAWWGSYDLISRALRRRGVGEAAVNFWAGGVSAQVFWTVAYPADVVKQRIMTDGWGAGRRYGGWWEAARAVRAEGGWGGFYRGFAPCFLRAFPANAAALVVFEAVMRYLP